MKTTKLSSLPFAALALAPPVLTAAAVNKHFANLITLGFSAPCDWAPRLAIATACLTVDLEDTEAEVRLQRTRANCRPDLSADEKSTARVKIAQTLATARAAHRLGKLAGSVFEEACAVGRARATLASINSAVAASEAEIVSLRKIIAERNEPACQKETMAIEALKDEENESRRTMLRCSSMYEDEMEAELREFIERKKYQWEPTQEGFTCRMREIEDEIQRFQDVIDEAPDPHEGKPTISSLLETMRNLEEPMEAMRREAEHAIERAAAAESELELKLVILDLQTAGILRCHELGREAGKLAGFAQPANSGDSQESAA